MFTTAASEFHQMVAKNQQKARAPCQIHADGGHSAPASMYDGCNLVAIKMCTNGWKTVYIYIYNRDIRGHHHQGKTTSLGADRMLTRLALPATTPACLPATTHPLHRLSLARGQPPCRWPRRRPLPWAATATSGASIITCIPPRLDKRLSSGRGMTPAGKTRQLWPAPL